MVYRKYSFLNNCFIYSATTLFSLGEKELDTVDSWEMILANERANCPRSTPVQHLQIIVSLVVEIYLR